MSVKNRTGRYCSCEGILCKHGFLNDDFTFHCLNKVECIGGSCHSDRKGVFVARELICPQCGSESVESTCMGGAIFEENDPNRVNCHSCGHNGTAQDWLDIAKYKEKVKEKEVSLGIRGKLDA